MTRAEQHRRIARDVVRRYLEVCGDEKPESPTVEDLELIDDIAHELEKAWKRGRSRS